MFLDRIITGNETWYHHFIPISKQASVIWKHDATPCSTKVRCFISVGKVLVTVSFDNERPLHVEFVEPGMTINADSYCNTLLRLDQAI